MNRYEKTLINNEHIVIKETNHLPKDMKGLYVDGLILLKDNLSDKEKLEVLGEELAHHDITYGDILDTNELWKWKFEHKARRLGFEKIIPLENNFQDYQSGVHNTYELSNYLDVSEGYIDEVLEHYQQKYGLSTWYENYLIKFNPLQVFEYKEIN